jgi:hypothetical protein
LKDTFEREEAMNCFQLVKTVLDDLYQEITSEYEADTDRAIRERIDQLHKYYGKSGNGNGIVITFSDPVTRFAYIFLSTTAHANIVYELITQSRVLQKAFDTEMLKVSCIGGGPGSDLLGILKYLSLHYTSDQLNSLMCYLCDQEKAWRESWCDVGSKLDSDFPCSVHTFSWELDVFDDEDLVSHRKIFEADLFTMIYFFSDPGVFNSKEDVRGFFEYWFARAKPGALFLFVDNSSWIFYNWFDDIAAQCRLVIVENEKQDFSHFVMDWREEKRDLGIYFEKFGDPKIQADIVYRVYRKPVEEEDELSDW